MAIKKLITQIRHPKYQLPYDNFEKWRNCFAGGDAFIQRYLQKFSDAEGPEAFKDRQNISYGPVFAKAALKEIQNSIYQRMDEIRRLGGPPNYQQAIQGFEAGVDLIGSSMNAFIGQDVLEELLVMGRVGIFVDKPQLNSKLKADVKDLKPYLYYYPREDILSWNGDYIDGDEVYTNVLLRTHLMVYDTVTGLPEGLKDYYRHFWLNADGFVVVDDWEEYYDEAEPQVLKARKVEGRNGIVTELTEVPFVMLDIGCSLMEDIANYQVALLNLASANLNYGIRANFVFYTEQYDPITEQTYSRRPTPPKIDPNNPLVNFEKLALQQGTAELASTASPVDKIKVGGVSGRRYGKGLNRPEFIAPPTEPIMASMEMANEMKAELREIINLSMSNIAPMHASAESKKEDKSGLENGLSGIGLELEYGERRIAKLWAMYENSKEIAQVNYPRKYDIKSDTDRQNEAKTLKDLKGAVPSGTFAKEVSKEIARKLLSGKVRSETITKVEAEIDRANYITSDYKEITEDVKAGLVSKETASNARGYDGAKEVPIAEKEYTERMAQIAASQASGLGAARGVGGNPGDASVEKQDSQNADKNPTSGGDMTRGQA